MCVCAWCLHLNYAPQVTEFLFQKPWLAEQGGEFTATVNKMIRNLNFQQVIIERMDRLQPVIHLTLKVGMSEVTHISHTFTHTHTHRMSYKSPLMLSAITLCYHLLQILSGTQRVGT